MIVERKDMTDQQLIEQYKEGRRDFSHVRIINGNFVGLNLSDVIFRYSDLTGSNFTTANLSNSDFTGATLVRAIFSGADLTNSKFNLTNMNYSDIRNCVIENTSFIKANLMWAHLCGDNLLRANITDAQLDWSCLVGSNLSQSQLASIPQQALTTIQQGVAHGEAQAPAGYGGAERRTGGYGTMQTTTGGYATQPTTSGYKSGSAVEEHEYVSSAQGASTIDTIATLARGERSTRKRTQEQC